MTGVRRPAQAVVVGRPAHPILLWAMVMTMTACTGGPASSGPEGEPSPAAPPTASASASAGAAAGRLEAVAGCAGEGPNNHVADFTWEPADPAGDGQQLVLSYLQGGLDTDAFVQTPPLPADQASYHWIHLDPGTEPRYWRVLTRYGETWVPSDTATFRGVDCPD